ncbi:outer membrane protein assembly factor BamB [Streptacidiphilus sp. MAP12-33]|uniref:protein kinase domain-containing protein n=1 Tax=Streptacidiphilus sp. MAP12-33 TaxID=3156266 RepID=UPI003517E927
MTAPTAAPSLTHIGPYRILRELGAGGMGRVYLAATASGRAVAVKVVHPEFAADPYFRRRFQREADAARAVSGAFTAPVVDCDPDGTPPWLATAYVPGPSLSEAIDAGDPMPEPSLRVLGAGLAEALIAVHRAGLVHRDLKPSNILLALDGPRVIDFGISKAADGTALTAEGQLIGSPGYMSPEHCEGRELSAASDVFSLGAVLAYAATGRPPFGVGATHAVLYRTVHEPPSLDGVPPGLLGIVAACLEKDPSRRPPLEHLLAWLRPGPGARTAGWLGPAEQQVAVRERQLAQALTPPGPTRRGLLLGGSAVLAAAAAGGAAWLLRPSGAGSGSATGPRLAWTAPLPATDMNIQSVTGTTVLCWGRTGAACLDLATGKALWHESDGSTTSAKAHGGWVYALRVDGKVHGLDARTGAQRWSTPLPGGGGSAQLQYADESLVVVAADQTFHALDAVSGALRWSRPVEGGDFLTGAVTGGPLVLNGVSKTPGVGNLYTVASRSNGTPLWSRPLRELYAPSTGGLLNALDAQRNLQGVDAASGTVRWSRASGLPKPTNAQETEYFLSLRLLSGTLFCNPMMDENDPPRSGLLAAFDPTTGAPRWSLDAPIAAEIDGYDVAGRTVGYVDKGVRGVDLRTGRPLWTVGTDLGALHFLGAVGGLLVAAASGHASGLYGFAPDTGHQAWHQPLTGATGSWATAKADGVLLGCCGSTLVCLTDSTAGGPGARPSGSRAWP